MKRRNSRILQWTAADFLITLITASCNFFPCFIALKLKRVTVVVTKSLLIVRFAVQSIFSAID